MARLEKQFAYALEHFGELTFKPRGGFVLRPGQSLPDLIWDQPETAKPMSVVVAQRGAILFAKGYGKKNGKPVTIQTPMLLHSAMKPLLGLQLALYVDQGYIQLDDPIGKFLPEFDTPKDKQLTFRAGFTHVTGIHFPWDLAFSRLFYFHTWHESLIAYCPRDWAPWDKYQYGVVGMILGVRAMELLSGQNYWQAMEDDLLTPLGITDVLPGGTGFSAEGLARIGVLLDNGGRYGTLEFISRATCQAIRPTPLSKFGPLLENTCGIGLQEISGLSPGSYGHSGGCGTQLMIDPEKHLVFAMGRDNKGEKYYEHLKAVLTVLAEHIS